MVESSRSYSMLKNSVAMYNLDVSNQYLRMPTGSSKSIGQIAYLRVSQQWCLTADSSLSSDRILDIAVQLQLDPDSETWTTVYSFRKPDMHATTGSSSYKTITFDIPLSEMTGVDKDTDVNNIFINDSISRNDSDGKSTASIKRFRVVYTAGNLKYTNKNYTSVSMTLRIKNLNATLVYYAPEDMYSMFDIPNNQIIVPNSQSATILEMANITQVDSALNLVGFIERENDDTTRTRLTASQYTVYDSDSELVPIGTYPVDEDPSMQEANSFLVDPLKEYEIRITNATALFNSLLKDMDDNDYTGDVESDPTARQNFLDNIDSIGEYVFNSYTQNQVRNVYVTLSSELSSVENERLPYELPAACLLRNLTQPTLAYNRYTVKEEGGEQVPGDSNPKGAYVRVNVSNVSPNHRVWCIWRYKQANSNDSYNYGGFYISEGDVNVHNIDFISENDDTVEVIIIDPMYGIRYALSSIVVKKKDIIIDIPSHGASVSIGDLATVVPEGADIDDPDYEGETKAVEVHWPLYVKGGVHGIGIKPGDVIEMPYGVPISDGFISASTQQVRMLIKFGCPIEATNVSVTGNVVIRGIKGYLNEMSSDTGINVNGSGYTTTASISGNPNFGWVYISIQKSSAFTNTTNNTPVSIMGANPALTLTFS